VQNIEYPTLIICEKKDGAFIKSAYYFAVSRIYWLAAMYIRKQNIFTEKRVYPYIEKEDLRSDLLPRVRLLAVNNAGGKHPWENMTDEELLKSAGLYGVDRAAGTEGFNLAAAMLLGRDYLIQDISPSSYIAKFIIEKNRMLVENANRATGSGVITPDTLEPNPKNPTIASFFRNIGRSDRLGSGVRNLFKYSKIYSGGDPEFIEGDVFRIIVPLDEDYSFDMETSTQATQGTTQATQASDQDYSVNLSEMEQEIKTVLLEDASLSQSQIANLIEVKPDTVKYYIR
jgi:predicted HTH transcriptional regulator